jgi:hypothetical protein
MHQPSGTAVRTIVPDAHSDEVNVVVVAVGATRDQRFRRSAPTSWRWRRAWAYESVSDVIS